LIHAAPPIGHTIPKNISAKEYGNLTFPKKITQKGAVSGNECAAASGVANSCVVLVDAQKSVSYIFFYILVNIAGIFHIIRFELYVG
jgi:hypothetical protein